ncbi:MAG: exodeoxyribonuclease VII large subunit [Gemmatimonadota bacterium]
MTLDLFDSAPSEPTVWTVSQINKAVRALLEDTLPPLWISGEVANWKRPASGHCYFTLKDESAQLRCVMWRGEAARLPMDPEEGMRVRVYGQLTLYEARGDYQLSVRTLEGEEGEGLWKLAFERLRGKLELEGLLLPERKRPLPRFPQTVGVVTSLTGAALHDILTVLRRRAPWLKVLVRGTRVQGEGAAQEIADALRVLGGSGRVEVVIVGRGGGSLEDLWAFNEELVARAVAECPVPVVSAVGHEVDVTISDLVADFRAPTPSTGAEAVAPDIEELLRYVSGAGTRLSRGLRRSVEGPRRVLSDRWARLRRSGLTLVEPRRRGLIQSQAGMARAIGSMLQNRRFNLVRLGEKMDALSPLSTLRRGYAVPLDSRGRVLRTPADFAPGEMFQLRVLNGRVEAETKSVQIEEVARDE